MRTHSYAWEAYKMQYQLRDDLSFCQIGGHVVFLDIRHDRYFRLPDVMERAFIAYANNNSSECSGLSALIKCNILAERTTIERREELPISQYVSSSALETSLTTHKFNSLAYLEVLTIVMATKWQLKKHPLKDILEKLVAYRQNKTLGLGMPRPSAERLLEAAILFRQMRGYIPIETSCLLDSLSLVKFLARRHLHSTIVFGVTLEPFLAHCWVQASDLMMNETIDQASTYTPIKMI